MKLVDVLYDDLSTWLFLSFNDHKFDQIIVLNYNYKTVFAYCVKCKLIIANVQIISYFMFVDPAVTLG